MTFVNLLSSITMQRFKKVVRADSEILALRKVEQKITYLPQKRIFFKKIYLSDFYLPFIILYTQQRLKKNLKHSTQRHRHINNNRSFDLIITDQICFVKVVTIKIGIFFFVSFLHSFFFIPLFTFRCFVYFLTLVNTGAMGKGISQYIFCFTTGIHL